MAIISVDVDLDEFDDADLVLELNRRGYQVGAKGKPKPTDMPDFLIELARQYQNMSLTDALELENAVKTVVKV